MKYSAAFALLLLVVACTPATTSRQGIADELRAAGHRVEDAGQIESGFFSVPGHVYVVDGNDLQVYDYASEAAASKDAALVKPNGAIGNSMPMWIAPPHFFHRGSRIVIYLGTNERILSELVQRMGPQFAGQ